MPQNQKQKVQTYVSCPACPFVAVNYLKYHMGLEFRAAVPARAAEDVYESVFGHSCKEQQFRKLRGDALMYWLTLNELAPLNLHKDISIGKLSLESLQAYDSFLHLHEKIFTPSTAQRAKVFEVVQGPCQVRSRGHTPRSSPQERQAKTLWTWMVHAGKSSRSTSSCSVMHEPARKQSHCTQFFAQNLAEIQELGWICHGFAPQAKEDPDLKQLKYWAIDHFNALRRKKACAYNPLHVKRPGKRFKGINLSAAEQVVSWFRNYARLLNEARHLRHSFKVLYFVKQRNMAIHSKKATFHQCHANCKNQQDLAKAQLSQPYQCHVISKENLTRRRLARE